MQFKFTEKQNILRNMVKEFTISEKSLANCNSQEEVADKGLQIHGGMVFSSELPLERFYRYAIILKIFEGTNEIQKLIINRYIIKKNGKRSN